MSLEEQLGMLRPAYEVESLVRAVVGSRSVETTRRGDCLSVSRPGASAPALQCYPAVVCVSLDPARAREVASASYVERVESKGVGTSYVWVPAARLQAGFDEALGLALEAVDRKARATATSSTPRQRTPRVAAPVVPEKVAEVCPRCGVQISAAGTCFCD